MTLSTADRVEILELSARYSWASDVGDIDTYLDTFTPDGQIDGEMAGVAMVVKGRDQLAEFKRSRESVGGRHWTNNHVFDEQDDHVRHRCYWNYFQPVGGDLQLLAMGSYDDRIVKHDGHWRFQRRTISFAPPPPRSDAASHAVDTGAETRRHGPNRESNGKIEGMWNVTLDGPQGPQKLVLTLERDDMTLSGGLVNAKLGIELEIENGIVDGDTLRWNATMTKPLQMAIAFTAAVHDGLMSGEATSDLMGTFPFEGERAS